MNEIYIVETSTQPGFWEISGKFAYTDEKSAIDTALSIIQVSEGRIVARVTTLNIVIN